MHIGLPALLDFHRAHRGDRHLVMALITGTSGSTYRKPGAMMLVSRDGAFEGLISGGCLESDLLHHAAEVMDSGQPRHVTYDMHADEDLVWNLGLGCDGMIQLLLIRLDLAPRGGLLARVDDAQARGASVLLATVVRSDGEIPLGAQATLDSSGISEGNDVLVGLLSDLAEDWPGWRHRTSLLDESRATEVFVVQLPPTPRVLLCGAGPDAVPLARSLRELGWSVVVADHRPAFARPDRFPSGCSVFQGRPEQLPERVALADIDAAVVMSHHLENDGIYLARLLEEDIPYVGVLGPRARRLKLQEQLGAGDRRVFGPVGLDIGAELPAAIALAVAAEIHAVLNQRDGRSLTRRGESKVEAGVDS